MKINREYGQVISSGHEETSTASIAMTAEMFQLLSSGIYEQKELAIVRELTCNASDANVEAGTTDTPIHIHVPNTLEPWWSVRDFGTGLSHEAVMELYLKYGFSTKGDSNDFIGAMGIGSKSPLSYSDSFLVNSFYEGVETQYNVYMDNGIPQVSKLFEQESSEPSGLLVTIQVQSKDIYTFVKETEHFLKLFPAKVEVSGATLSTSVEIQDKGLYWWVSGYEGAEFIALMGGVPYRISKDFYKQIEGWNQFKNTMVIPFEIGELSVAASRETLSLDEKTSKVLYERVVKISAKIREDMQQEIDKAEDIFKAYVLAYQKFGLHFGWSSPLELSTFTFQGKTFIKWKEELEKSTKFRMYSCFDHKWRDCNLYTIWNSLNRRGLDNWVIVNPDRRNGSIRFSVEAAKRTGKTVLLVNDGATRDLLFQYLDTSILDVSEHYEFYFPFPKGASNTKTYRKTSGVFSLCRGDEDWTEVTSLNTEEKGYYLPVERFSVKLFKTDGTLFSSTYSYKKYNFLVESHLLEKVYFVRKTALKQLKGVDGLKELKFEDIQNMIDKKSNKFARKRISQYEACNYLSISPDFHCQELEEVLSTISPKRRALLDMRKKSSPMRSMYEIYVKLREASYMGFKIKPLKTNSIAQRWRVSLGNEEERVMSEYSLLKLFFQSPYHWELSSKKELADFIKYKLSK